MNWALYVIAGLAALDALAVGGSIGRVHKPTGRSCRDVALARARVMGAAFRVVVAAATAVLLVVAARRLT